MLRLRVDFVSPASSAQHNLDASSGILSSPRFSGGCTASARQHRRAHWTPGAVALVLACLLGSPAPCLQAQNITSLPVMTTVAGNGTSGYTGNGGPATGAELYFPEGVAVDSAGNLYIGDTENQRIRKVNTSGTITTVAGVGIRGYSGDGGPATSAELNYPQGVAVDSAGNLYIADARNQVIRKVNTSGAITTVVGNGSVGYSGDGGPATSAELNNPTGVAVDSAGNLYIADASNQVIRKVNTSGTVTTVAGNGRYGYSGDNGPATSAELTDPWGVAVDSAGDLYIADAGNSVIRKVNASGTISTVAGNGSQGYSGDGGPATSAELSTPFGVAVDSAGNLYIADRGNSVIRKVNASGTISTVAGDGTAGYSGDGGPATSAELNGPFDVAVDSAGNLYIGDTENQRIRKVAIGPINFGSVNVTASSTENVVLSINTALTLSSVQTSGDYSVTSDSCNPLPAVLSANTICTLQVQFTPTELGQRWFPLIATDSNSNQYSFGLEGTGVGSALAFTPGIISTVAGNGTDGYSGDGGPATSAELSYPQGVAVDSAGDLYIADTYNEVIRKVNTSGTVTTVAGNGRYGYSGDNGPATSAELSYPQGVAVDSAGNLYIADRGNSVIRKVNTSGIITTVAGNDTYGYSGDNGPATSAELSYPQGVAVDSAGNLYIADTGNHVIRKVNTSGTITTVAGNGTEGYSGDNGPATSAELSYPTGMAVDSAGNLYIADTYNEVIRKVNTSGIITTVAGNDTYGYSGDNGPATSAELNYPYGVAVDSAGNLYIADTDNHVIRKVNTSGTITTVAGNGTGDYSGDNGPATSAELSTPFGVAVGSAGNLYIADLNNSVIRKVNVTTSALSFGSLDLDQVSSPQSMVVSDVGTAPLNFTSPFAFPPNNFELATVGGDCSIGTPLAVGTDCNLGASFVPMASGTLAGAIIVTDDAINSPQLVSLTGTGVPSTVNVTVGTSPAALSFTVDGTPYSSAQTLTWTVGTMHTLAITSPQIPVAGTQYTFTGWSDGTTNLTDSVMASASTTSYTASFATSYQLTTAVSPGGGTVTPTSGGYYAAVSAVPLAATPSAGYTFTGWTGPVASPSSASTTVTMNGPESVTANFQFVLLSQSITFAALPNQALDNAPFAVSATASSNLVVSFASTTQSVCTVSGMTVTLVAAGACTIQATQAGNANYAAATPVSQSFQVAQPSQIVSFTGVQTTLPTGGLSYPYDVAVDRAGDVFVADFGNNRIVEVPAGGGAPTTVPTSGLSHPAAVALDGAGDLFVADYGNNRVVEIPAGGGAQITLPASGLNQPSSVAVDGAGDVFIADAGNNRVVELPAGGGAQTTVGSGLNYPLGVAVDGAGDIFIADCENNRVVEIPASGGAQTTVPTSLNQPNGVAVDAAGNIFIAYSNSSQVVEVPAGGGAQITVGSGLNHPTNLAVDAAGDVFIADTNNGRVVEVQLNAVNFGGVNVCPLGQTSPAPCIQTVTLNYNVNADVTLAANPTVVIQGAPSLDFSLGSATCSGTITAGISCTVNVEFTPLAPGLRMGAVQLNDSSGNLLATTFVRGVGEGPAIAFGPGTQTTIGTGFNTPVGVAVDGTGDVFIADTGNSRVVEFPQGGGTQVTVGSGLDQPYGVAIDGAGDVLIADTYHNRVLKVPAGGGAQVTVGSGLSFPNGVAVDGAGDVFIADQGNSRVVEVTPSGTQTTLDSGLNAKGVAVDGAGNVFIADFGDSQVVELPAGGGTPITLGTGLDEPQTAAVDGAGDVFVANYGNGQVVEIPAGGGAQIALGSGLSHSTGVAVDAAGDVFVADYGNSRVVEIQQSQPPSLSFATTIAGLTSTDSPQSVTVQNVGNQPLAAVSPGLIIGTNSFEQVAGSGTPADCTSSFSLAPGASCNLSVSFIPQRTGIIGNAVTLTDNTLNFTPSASQSIALSGTGQSVPTTTTISAPTITYGSNGQVTVAISASEGTATGNVSLTVDNGTPIVQSLSNGQAIFTLTTPGAGNHALVATYPAQGNLALSSATGTLTVNQATSALTWATPAAITYGTALSGTQLHATAAVPGMFAYAPASGAVLNAGSQTLSVTFTPSDSVDYATATITVTLVVNKATPTVAFVGAPATAPYNSTFVISSTTNATPKAVITASGVCMVFSNAVITMTSGTGICNLTATWAPDNNYLGAVATQSTTATKIAPTVTFTGAPAMAPYQGAFTVVATTNASTAATIMASGVCTIAATTVTITAPSGTCALSAAWAADSNYLAANATQSTTATKAMPAITWPMPSPITYGTALTGTQLDASAAYNGSSVGGTFTYSPAKTTVLSAGAQMLSVTFAPNNTTNYNSVSASVTLQVNQATPKITWAKPAAITYGTALSATQLDATASVAGTFAYSPAGGTVLSAGTQQTLSVTFTPTDAVDYTPASDSVTINVQTATPTITWATPAAITYGTALSGRQLNATASVPGTFVYSPAAGAIEAGGSDKLSVTFTPSDTTDYVKTTASVTLQVNPATPTISWPTPTAITYGTALTGTQLDATAMLNGNNVGGTYVYTPAKGATPGAGAQTLSVTFTPNNTANYTGAAGSVTLQVNPATPQIAWTKPAAITYGTALSGTQLDATASVPGTFAYSPAAGTILPGGTDTLSVTFTPVNTTNYSTATDSVTINVNPATSTTMITSNTPDPSSVNEAVTVSFSVMAGSGIPGVPTGSVTVTASTSETCTGRLNSGTGSCTLTFTATGSPNVAAVYNGDSNFKTSTSAKVTQNVQ